jgi:hypothetical protein
MEGAGDMMAAVRSLDRRQVHAGIEPADKALCGATIAELILSDTSGHPVPFVTVETAQRCPWCHFQMWHTGAGQG